MGKLLNRDLGLGVTIVSAVFTLSCGGATPTAPAPVPLRSSNGDIAPSPNGIEFPTKYKNWPVLSIGHRLDKRRMAVVVGNRTAVIAARKGNTNPWPNGTIIGNVVYEQEQSENMPSIISAGTFVRAEFMIKDRKSYAANRSGWGFARWNGAALEPYGSNQDFQDECIQCHEKVSGNDWLFMKPTLLP